MAVLTEEQSMLKDQAQAWVRDESPVQKFRQMRDSGTPKRFDEATWSDISTMGWAGILVPEELGGSGMDYATFGVVLEETGIAPVRVRAGRRIRAHAWWFGCSAEELAA